MTKKNTDDLRKELAESPSLGGFLASNQEQFVSGDFAGMLQELFQRSGLTKAALAKKAGSSEVYLYQLFAGQRRPSRDRTICLCFGLSATLEETQELLKRSGLAELYVKNRRDAIIMYGMTHQQELSEINDKLYAEGEETLC